MAEQLPFAQVWLAVQLVFNLATLVFVQVEFAVPGLLQVYVL